VGLPAFYLMSGDLFYAIKKHRSIQSLILLDESSSSVLTDITNLKPNIPQRKRKEMHHGHAAIRNLDLDDLVGG
jgi:hypothetical protein